MKNGDNTEITKLISEIEDIPTLLLLKEEIDKKLMQKAGIESLNESREILLLDLSMFLKNNNPHMQKNFSKFYSLISAIRKIKNVDISRKVKVFDALGINPYELEKYPGCGEKTINILNNCLKKYGLSLKTKLPAAMISELNLNQNPDLQSNQNRL